LDDAAYLRQQAERCLRLARRCWHLEIATELRFMAADLNAKAAALEADIQEQRKTS
jgi:hypothetical protein